MFALEYTNSLAGVLASSGAIAVGTARIAWELRKRRERKLRELAEQAAHEAAQREIRGFMFDLVTAMFRDAGGRARPVPGIDAIPRIIDARSPPREPDIDA